MTTERDLIDELHAQADADRDPEATPDVGIIMGSDSDPDVMSGAHEVLDTFGSGEQTDFDAPPKERFSYETYVVSAYRTSDLMYAYGDIACGRGVEVTIAGAGGRFTDPPNMTASIVYPTPVVGVPVQEESVDSVIGMSTGAPIVAADAGKSFDATLSAVQALSRGTSGLEGRLADYHEDLVSDMAETSAVLHDLSVASFRESW